MPIKLPRIERNAGMPSSITGGVNVSPESAGASVGRAVEGLGQSLMTVSGIMAQQAEQDTKVAAADYQNQLQTTSQQFKEAFQNQYKESAALNKTKEIDDHYRELETNIPSFFKTSSQRKQLFNSILADSKANTLTWYAQYEGEQRADWVKNVSKNIIDTGKQEVLKADLTNLETTVNSYTDEVMGINGNHDEATQKMLRESISSDLYETAIRANINSNPKMAQGMLDIAMKNSLISPNIIDGIKTDIYKAEQQKAINDEVKTALAMPNPQDGMDYINNSTAISDEMKEKAITAYKSEYSFNRQIQKDKSTAVFNDVSKNVEVMLLSGRYNPGQINSYILSQQDMDGDDTLRLTSRVDNYFDEQRNEAIQAANYAYTQESRAELAERRQDAAYTRQLGEYQKSGKLFFTDKINNADLSDNNVVDRARKAIYDAAGNGFEVNGQRVYLSPQDASGFLNMISNRLKIGDANRLKAYSAASNEITNRYKKKGASENYLGQVNSLTNGFIGYAIENDIKPEQMDLELNKFLSKYPKPTDKIDPVYNLSGQFFTATGKPRNLSKYEENLVIELARNKKKVAIQDIQDTVTENYALKLNGGDTKKAELWIKNGNEGKHQMPTYEQMLDSLSRGK